MGELESFYGRLGRVGDIRKWDTVLGGAAFACLGLIARSVWFLALAAVFFVAWYAVHDVHGETIAGLRADFQKMLDSYELVEDDPPDGGPTDGQP